MATTYAVVSDPPDAQDLWALGEDAQAATAALVAAYTPSGARCECGALVTEVDPPNGCEHHPF